MNTPSPVEQIQPRRISCGCCTGIGNDPKRDRCCCWNHQDVRIGQPWNTCEFHKAGNKKGLPS